MHGGLAELVLVEVKVAEEADHLKDSEKDDKCWKYGQVSSFRHLFFSVQPPKLCDLVKYITLPSFIQ